MYFLRENGGGSGAAERGCVEPGLQSRAVPCHAEPSRAVQCCSPAEMLHAATPRLPELHVPPQRLL